ncbi:nuclear transport factor 2 family protein [Nocardioides sp. NBC_00163]|uniref:nuclear transport factor 2 family protein n=1 Tax=Nocardioides sp. NBC_00163 TaxID=2975999 RepID=UPI003250C48A
MNDSPAGRRLDTTQDVRDLIINTWWNVDHEAAVGGERYFTPDGVCQMPAITMTGREEIAAGYAKRQAAGARLSRHLVTNLVVQHQDDLRARARYVLTLYAGRGRQPGVLTEPQAVVDVVDECVRDDGRWLIEYRLLTSVFISASNDSVMLEPRHDD